MGRRPRGALRARAPPALLAVLLVVGGLAIGFASPARGSGASPSAPGPAPPPAAFALSSNGIAPAAISLVWNASTEAYFDNYSVTYSTAGPSGPWSFAVEEPNEGTTTAVVPDLAPGATYWWNVTAYYQTGLLGLGGTAADSSTVLNATQPAVAVLSSPSNTSTSVALAWTNSARYGGGIGFGEYDLEEVVDNVTDTYATIDSVASAATNVTGLSAGSSYSFYVRTVDSCAGCPANGTSATESNVLTAGTATSLVASLAVALPRVDAGLPDQITCTPDGGTPPYTFAWNFTNGTTLVAGPGTTSRAYAAAGTYVVSCQVTDHASNRYLAAPATIFVDAAPGIAASASPLNATVGDPVAFACVGTPGTSPLAVVWTLGNGRTLANAAGSDAANGSTSYAAAGTYVAQCVVTDALGVRTAASAVVHVQPRPVFTWIPPAVVLFAAAGVGAALAGVSGVVRRRDASADRTSVLSRWLPPTGPSATVHGAKTCPRCGASNVPIRRSCQACGSPLPRNPGS